MSAGQDAFTVDQAAFKADQAAFEKFQEQSATEIASQITDAEARKVRLTTAEAALKADQAGLEAREAKLKIDVADFAKGKPAFKSFHKSLHLLSMQSFSNNSRNTSS